jgi:two-component system chemotaxis sensor kinase CheA
MTSSSDDNFDLSQFHGVFFDEAAEHLDGMEALLLDIDLESADDEQLNAIFRAAHSIKGGAATFAFKDITELTHEMETVFDRVRKGQMPLSRELVDVFLASGDMLKAMLTARREGGEGMDEEPVRELCVRLRGFLETDAHATVVSSAPAVAAPEATVPRAAAKSAAATTRVLEIVFGPFDRKFPYESVDGVVGDLKDFGTIEELPVAVKPPARSRAKAPAEGKTRARAAKPKLPAERRFHITTEVTASDLLDAISFMADPDRVTVTCIEELAPEAAATAEPAGMSAGSAAATAEPAVAMAVEAVPAPAPQASGIEDEGFGLFVDPKTLPANQPRPEEAKAAGEKVVSIRNAKPAAAQTSDATSIRVSVEKVDQLINLVGELVITQAMLAQTASQADPVLYESLLNGLAQLQRNTRDLQESAMSIRMMPMSFVFSRFPRVVRDVAAKLGKEVELQTVGENTELDKGLIERIVDPLTHLVRNSLDHGLEPAEERVASGKVRHGTITLRAYHQGGAIVIEVSDDGRGLHREKILAKARERGMDVSDAMSDQDVWSLIFEAGFSTAEKITDVSGRGVGMDVVRRNIQEMGGRVEIDSAAGIGTRISIKLPLTLAILDGMSVRVGSEIFILPLNSIAESLQPKADAVNAIAGRGRVVTVRGEYLPVLSLAEVYGMRGEKERYEDGILVIMESEGSKTALFVDDLVGQHQVVIKSLETNYKKVAGISGATIMGDGRVAMILDVAHIVGLAHSRIEKAA